MKTCFSTLGCPQWTFAEIVAAAADLHYDGIEVRGVKNELFAPAIEDFSPAKIEATKQKLADLSLSIPCITSSCNLNDESVLALAKANIELASKLDAPYVRLLGDMSPRPNGGVNLRVIVSNLEAIAEYAGGLGVTPLVETNGFFAKTRVLAALLESLKTGGVGVLYDVHHPYRFFGEGADYVIDKLGPYIKHVHIKDSVMRDNKVIYRMPGEGDVPVEEAVRMLLAAGYEGFFSLEWVKRWDATLEEPGIVFAQYKEFMDRIVA